MDPHHDPVTFEIHLQSVNKGVTHLIESNLQRGLDLAALHTELTNVKDLRNANKQAVKDVRTVLDQSARIAEHKVELEKLRPISSCRARSTAMSSSTVRICSALWLSRSSTAAPIFSLTSTEVSGFQQGSQGGPGFGPGRV